MTSLRGIGLALAFFGLAAGGGQARAEDFYRGKTLTIVVGFTPGGGFDIYARTLARFIGRHIPGNPNVIVQNMPGAASLNSILYLDSSAPKDGTVIDTFNFGEIGDSKLDPDKVRIDFRKFAWIGSVAVDETVCYVWHTLGVNNLAELQKHGLIHTGLTAVGSSSDINQRILKYIFKVDVKQVAGYPGSAEERLGIENGELDGDCGAWSSLPANWTANHLIRPIMRSAPDLSPGMPANIPLEEALASNDEDRKVIHLLINSGQVGRPFIASLRVPPDRIQTLRAAFDETMKDPAFVAELKRLNLPYAPKNGAQALATVNSIYDAPGTVVREARKIATE